MAEDTRPLCKCHGEPMSRNGNYMGTQRYMCARARREHSKLNYWQHGRKERLADQYVTRKAEGLCVRCGAPPIGAVCWDCLNEMEARHALRV